MKFNQEFDSKLGKFKFQYKISEVAAPQTDDANDENINQLQDIDNIMASALGQMQGLLKSNTKDVLANKNSSGLIQNI